MATRTDKERNERSKTPTSTDKSTTTDQGAKPGRDKSTDAKEDNTYDPVGMAGKKAGIVQDLNEQARAEKGGDKERKGKA